MLPCAFRAFVKRLFFRWFLRYNIVPRQAKKYPVALTEYINLLLTFSGVSFRFASVFRPQLRLSASRR